MRKLRCSFLVLVIGLTFGSVIHAQTAPVINSVSPASATVGTTLTINGTGFGTSQGLTSTINFAGVPASPRVLATTWNNQQITVKVPLSAITGTVSVTVSSHVSNAAAVVVAPTVSSISPAAAVSGTSVTINGSGFGSSQASGSSTVSFNGVLASPTLWSSTSIVAPVPSSATAGPLVVTVAGQSISSSSNFTPTPVISGVSPGSGVAGSTVNITGNSFGNSQGSSTVTLNGIAAGVSSWTNSAITATVPSGAASGSIQVAVNTVASNSVSFNVLPGITALSPNPGLAGSPISITGTSFGTTQGTGTVTFNGVAASVVSWSNTLIQATVPDNTVAGPVIVTAGGLASNGVPFSLASLYRYDITYSPNGNVLTANDSVNGNWTYSYDDFNRLASANQSNLVQGYSYDYDEVGNRWRQNLTVGAGSVSNLTFSLQTVTTNGNCYHGSGVTNQPDGFCFDAAGNLLGDGQHTYTYDAENRILSIDGGQGATYLYDGDDRRIRKATPAATVDYLYDLGGRTVTEVTDSAAWNRTEIYASGRHLGTYTNGKTYFTQSDWIGTERARVLPTGDVYETCASLPFGDGLKCTGAADVSPNHFTGKPHDTESNLEYFGARYFASALGRFVTPDQGPPEPANPQSWNLYRYTKNNPLAAIDPDGHSDIPAQSANINRSLARDPALLEVIKASNNFSQRGFEEALNRGALNNLNQGAGNILRGLAGEASLLEALRTVRQTLSAFSQPTNYVEGVLPDIVQILPSGQGSFTIPLIGTLRVPHYFTLNSVLISPTTTGSVNLSTKNQLVAYEVKSGFSPSSIGKGVAQTVATAAALNATGKIGTAVLAVDKGAWDKLSPTQKTAYFNAVQKAGGQIWVVEGLAAEAQRRAEQAVQDARSSSGATQP